MHQDPSSQEYADEVARLRASESDSDAELLVRLDMFYLYSTLYQKSLVRRNLGLGSSYAQYFANPLREIRF
jgi:hypothetical protein